MRGSLESAKGLVAKGRQDDALTALRAAFTPDAAFAMLSRAAKWSAGVDWSGLRPLKVAFLGGGTLDHLVDFIRFRALLEGFRLECLLPAYDTWRTQILDPDSELYRFRPDVAWFFTHWRDARWNADPGASVGEAEGLVARELEEVETRWRTLSERLPSAQIMQNSLDPAVERVFGNLEASLPGSLPGLTRAFNLRLSLSAPANGVAVFDLERLAIECGLDRWHNPGYWFHSKHPFSPDLAGFVAFRAARQLAAAKGSTKKALVVDLDDTLWGGVIGDDGVEGIRLGDGADGEAFTAFQAYLKALTRRGIVLAVASKNEMAAAMEPFRNHPGMRLTLDDIAVFKANWNNKADNIRDIAATLDLGLDAFVFVDDNPAERELVRRELPMVAVPEMPREPAEYIRALERHAYFEAMSFSAEDAKRVGMYRDNAKRADARSTAASLDEYLTGLEMVADSGPADAFHLPRMAQLINKSNQFHPTTTRYTEAELRVLAARDDCIVRWFSLRDRFGDHGLIAALILKRDGGAFVIDTWAMSCRVLGRGMEEYIANVVADLVLSAGGKALVGKYIATTKNALVADLYPNLGFCEVSPGDVPRRRWNLILPAKPSATAIRTASKKE